MTDVAVVQATAAMAPAMIADRTTATVPAQVIIDDTMIITAAVDVRTTRAMAIPRTETPLAIPEGTAEAMLGMTTGMVAAADGTIPPAMGAPRARMAMTGPATQAAITIMTAEMTATAVVDMTPPAMVVAAAMALHMAMTVLRTLADTVLAAPAGTAAATTTGLLGVPELPTNTTKTTTSRALEAAF